MAKLQDVANYILHLDKVHDEDGAGISNLKLQKLVYYAQGFFLAIFGRQLFDEEIEAWTHGPVVPALYHHYKGCGKAPISCDPSFDTNSLESEEKELIEEVFEVFGKYTAWKLREMTHEDQPWIEHEGADIDAAKIIPKEKLFEFFKTRIN